MIINPLNQHHSKVLSAVATGHACLHFSQLGEDGVIWKFYHNVKNGFYVDIGCHHPFRYSNTALLSIFNDWRGINIDADARAIDLFRQYRPHDINILSAVGNQTGSAEMFWFERGPAVNTLDPGLAAMQTKYYGAPEKRTVDVLPLNELLDRHMPADTAIDLMNVDIEGFDLPALQSNNWKRYRPKLLCVETHDMNINEPTENATFQYMKSVGYELKAQVLATSVYIPVPGWSDQAGPAKTATGRDCFAFARATDDPKVALLYYSAAEAAGIDDPDLWCERDRVLRDLGEVELRYLNARYGSWRDETVLSKTLSEVKDVHYEPSDFPTAIRGADAAQLMQEKQFCRVLQICKFLVQQDREVAYACFMAGCSAAQITSNEALALTWLNMAVRSGSGSKYWINLTRTALLRRIGLPWLALGQIQQLDRDGLADSRSFKAYYNIIEQLLAATLQSSTEREPLLQALHSFNDAKEAYLTAAPWMPRESGQSP